MKYLLMQSVTKTNSNKISYNGFVRTFFKSDANMSAKFLPT